MGQEDELSSKKPANPLWWNGKIKTCLASFLNQNCVHSDKIGEVYKISV